MLPTTFRALVVEVAPDGAVHRQVRTRTLDDLPAGDLVIRVYYSSLNYKDALSANGNRGVTRAYPHTPGIDAAGIVVASAARAFQPGDEVLVIGHDLGMNTSGGFGQYIRVPAAWVIPRPPALSLHAAMAFGTAGFTAELALQRLAAAGLTPEAGEVLVTGATGGVGSFAVAFLAQAGYTVVAATGKPDQYQYLRDLGASEVIERAGLEDAAERALLRPRWAATIDNVGGTPLASAIKATRPYGYVACCGNAASPELHLTVYPFILRGVSLIGIDSANCAPDLRRRVWDNLAHDADQPYLAHIARDAALDDLETHIKSMLAGQLTGRIVVDLWT
jgi:putative YhdH/YhfP family quinone oxidoreductase